MAIDSIKDMHGLSALCLYRIMCVFSKTIYVCQYSLSTFPDKRARRACHSLAMSVSDLRTSNVSQMVAKV